MYIVCTHLFLQERGVRPTVAAGAFSGDCPADEGRWSLQLRDVSPESDTDQPLVNIFHLINYELTFQIIICTAKKTLNKRIVSKCLNIVFKYEKLY